MDDDDIIKVTKMQNFLKRMTSGRSSRNHGVFRKCLEATNLSTLLGANISAPNGTLEDDDFPAFPRWDMYPFPGVYTQEDERLEPTAITHEKKGT